MKHFNLLLISLSIILLMSGCGADGSGVSKEQYDQLAMDLSKSETEMTSLKEQLTQKDQKIKELEEKITQLEENKTQMNEKIEQLDENLSMYRDKTQSSNTKVITGNMSPQAAEYAKLIDIQVLSCRYLRKHSIHRHPGLQLKIENKGARQVTGLDITVYFLDKDNKIIADETFQVITMDGTEEKPATGPLKPNYAIKIPLNETELLAASKVPNEWKEGSIDLKISGLELASRR